jgi:hypothetical protein
MRQYVGTHAAPASAALIFWAFGRGQIQAAIKKFADLTFIIIREQQKRNSFFSLFIHHIPHVSSF